MFFLKKKKKYEEIMTCDSNFLDPYSGFLWLSEDKKIQFYLICQKIKELLEKKDNENVMLKFIRDSKEKIIEMKNIKKCLLLNNEFMIFYLKDKSTHSFYPEFKRNSLSIITNKEEQIIWSN